MTQKYWLSGDRDKSKETTHTVLLLTSRGQWQRLLNAGLDHRGDTLNDFSMCICFIFLLCLCEHCSHPRNAVGHIMRPRSPFHHAFICKVDRVAIRRQTMQSWKHISLFLDKGETKRGNCLLGAILGPGIVTFWGSNSSAQLTFFIKPHCVIMASQRHLPLCLISHLMLLLCAASPSFVLLKYPLSFHYHREIEFIYCKRRKRSSCVRVLLNLNNIQFQVLQHVDGLQRHYLHRCTLRVWTVDRKQAACTICVCFK